MSDWQMRRSLILHIGLFIVAYSGCLTYFWFTDPHRDSLPAIFASGASGQHPATANTSGFKVSTDSARSSEVPEVEPIPETTHTAATVEQRQPTIDQGIVNQVNALTEQAMSSSAPEERALAIARLRSAERTQQTIQTLANAIRTDPTPSNRLMAISSLRNLSNQGDSDGAVRAALSTAMDDFDPRVAKFARDAHAYVVERNPEGR